MPKAIGSVPKYAYALAVIAALVFLLLPLAPATAAEGLVPCGNPGQPACQPCHIVVLVIRLINFGIKYLAVPLAILMFIWAGFTYALSGGSDKRIQSGKTILTNTVIGLLIVFGAYFIVDTAIKALTGDFRNKNFIGAFGPWNAPTLEGTCGLPQIEKAPEGLTLQQSESKALGLIKTVANTIGIVLMGLSVLMVLYAAFLFITGGGNEDKIGTARKVLIFALIGVAVALLAYAIPTLVSSIFSNTSTPPT